jgi:putative transposase
MKLKHIKEQSVEFPVNELCRVLKVSRARYYEWLTGKESKRSQANRILGVAIKVAHEESDQTYGAIRIHRELQANGTKCGKNRVARIMKSENLRSVHKTKYKACTTDSKHSLTIADNVIEQDFTATAPNQKWGADITYIETGEGFLYLAVVLDFYNRKVVGWAVGDSLHADLCCEALKMALAKRRPPANLIHHSDRGVQYASSEYRELLTKHNFSQSMSRKGNCYDNAMVESFMHTLKVERVHRRNYINRLAAKLDIAYYIENFYNQKRRHSALDYLSPVQYEAKFRRVA